MLGLHRAGVGMRALRRAAVPALVLTGASAAAGAAGSPDILTFHRDAQRTGWHAGERSLTPRNVAPETFGQIWQSPPLDAVAGKPPRLYASPLYLDQLTLSAGPHAGGDFSVVLAASSNGFVYAINAFATPEVPAGTILWRTELERPGGETDGVVFGVLSTPVIDATRRILYVTTCVAGWNWLVYAIDVTSGRVLPRWPLRIENDVLNALDRNAGRVPFTGPVVLEGKRQLLGRQRGALTLGAGGTRLYVTFGESPTGWIAAVDTVNVRIASSFGTVATQRKTAGGIWGAGGASLDADGRIYFGTGSNFGGLTVQAHDWTQSVLQLTDSPADGLTLTGTYTPFNYGGTATADVDLGSGGVTVIPDLDPARTATPRLLTIGGKQGNVYLVNRDPMPGRLDRRPAPSTDPESDASLLAPSAQPQFKRRGPLVVFGPYTETEAAVDQARSRSVAAYFRDENGSSYLFVTGSSKKPEDMTTNVAPGLARLRIVKAPGKPAYLEIDAFESTLVFENPGSPVVTSNGARDPVVWVLDQNAFRSALLDGASAPRPRLYAIDGRTMKPLWASPPDELFTSGKYNEPAIARGTVFVGTDRIQAYGLRDSRAASVSFPSPGPPETEMKMTPIEYGRFLYNAGGSCATCHQPDGKGVPRAFPPLAGSERVTGPDDRLIRIVLHGLQGPTRAMGLDYEGAAMPAFGRVPGSAFNWTDEKVSAVLTYIRQEWGHRARWVSPERVAEIRLLDGDRPAWTEPELLKK
jgi:mono/diheme cytochrome c family protein